MIGQECPVATAHPVDCIRHAGGVPATLSAPNMVLVGASARNAGKSALVARLIQAHATYENVVAAKIITIHSHGDACPRGGQGCGICAGLDHSFEIREELADGEKDTMLFRRAGAQRVYLVRTYPAGLRAAARELFRRAGPGVRLICESNSLRKVVEPGVFYMIRDTAQACKPSALEVLPMADVVLEPYVSANIRL